MLSVDIVTADGRLLIASADEHPDLFWAVRGGGGNFGVVTSFEYQLHEVGPLVVGGMALFPAERAGEVLRAFREIMDVAPAACRVRTLFTSRGYSSDCSSSLQSRWATWSGCVVGSVKSR